LPKNDKPDGRWMFYSRDGRLVIKGNFDEGFRRGEWIYYDRKGHIIEIERIEESKDIPNINDIRSYNKYFYFQAHNYVHMGGGICKKDFDFTPYVKSYNLDLSDSIWKQNKIIEVYINSKSGYVSGITYYSINNMKCLYRKEYLDFGILNCVAVYEQKRENDIRDPIYIQISPLITK
jgi:antitoxin component YwqK of YwqJK toxin-antitoxin module